jgi:hypothetical protein
MEIASPELKRSVCLCSHIRTWSRGGVGSLTLRTACFPTPTLLRTRIERFESQREKTVKITKRERTDRIGFEYKE